MKDEQELNGQDEERRVFYAEGTACGWKNDGSPWDIKKTNFPKAQNIM